MQNLLLRCSVAESVCSVIRRWEQLGHFDARRGIILRYVRVVCFLRRNAFPTVSRTSFWISEGYLYTVAGFDIYASWLAMRKLYHSCNSDFCQYHMGS